MQVFAFGKVDAGGGDIGGSGNWTSQADQVGVYRINFSSPSNDDSPTVILSPGDAEGPDGIQQSDNIFVPFNVSSTGFSVKSRDISGGNAGDQDCPFNFVALAM